MQKLLGHQIQQWVPIHVGWPLVKSFGYHIKWVYSSQKSFKLAPYVTCTEELFEIVTFQLQSAILIHCTYAIIVYIAEYSLYI